MPEFTPIRVRGKRNGIAAEKWNYGKKRKVHRIQSTLPLQQGASSQAYASASEPSSRRKRRSPSPQLSRLEELPTEVIQHIFDLSANVELPSSSPRLAVQLNSTHLYHRLTARLLEPTFGDEDPGAVPLTAATRLMNSKFFGYTFFRDWLLQEYERLNLSTLDREQQSNQNGDVESETNADETVASKDQTAFTWTHLAPSHKLLPPAKLLRGPFSDDKIRLLGLLISHTSQPLVVHYPYLHDLVREGLQQAVADNSIAALNAFWHLGLLPDTNLLRQAVTTAGCDRRVVSSIMKRSFDSSTAQDIEWLDPEIWSWAERATARGDAADAYAELSRHDLSMQ
ncbi:uncharacterized protein LTR77_000395 [Saxophila tyrrhenica]|uniref:F-box domain-containing protein n=1 Tax=Saxophila tyrrhenica TaxID=1690608 RepID=A0AAV9PSB7_9PEZI|nr:hypothetical protein LTR77_000395 [Saxophila tyrrhenica]